VGVLHRAANEQLTLPPPRPFKEYNTHSRTASSNSNRIFIAVANPRICTLPQSRHLMHPTQSMMLLTFLKCSLNSSLSAFCSPRKSTLSSNLPTRSLMEMTSASLDLRASSSATALAIELVVEEQIS